MASHFSRQGLLQTGESRNKSIVCGGKLLEQPDQLKKSAGKETMLLKHQRHRTHFMNLVLNQAKVD